MNVWIVSRDGQLGLAIHEVAKGDDEGHMQIIVRDRDDDTVLTIDVKGES